MAKLIYMTNTSLDGYIEDESGSFDWTEPDPEVHTFINDLVRPMGTFLFGRRLYETMAVWDTIGLEPTAESSSGNPPVPPEQLEFARVWRTADKLVYSRTLEAVAAPRTRLEGEFDPDSIRRLKYSEDRELLVGGAGLAQAAFSAGLVDEVRLLVYPVIVGGGKPGLPHGIRLDLTLLDERRFGNGIVHLRYQVK